MVKWFFFCKRGQKFSVLRNCSTRKQNEAYLPAGSIRQLLQQCTWANLMEMPYFKENETLPSSAPPSWYPGWAENQPGLVLDSVNGDLVDRFHVLCNKPVPQMKNTGEFFWLPDETMWGKKMSVCLLVSSMVLNVDGYMCASRSLVHPSIVCPERGWNASWKLKLLWMCSLLAPLGLVPWRADASSKSLDNAIGSTEAGNDMLSFPAVT